MTMMMMFVTTRGTAKQVPLDGEIIESRQCSRETNKHTDAKIARIIRNSLQAQSNTHGAGDL
jgi:hypothetical protein